MAQPQKARVFTIDESACISALTEAELRYGVAKSENPRERDLALDVFLAKIEVLNWGIREAAACGLLRASQETAGKSLDSFDMIIGAHAVATGSVLVTNDKAFSYMRQLTVLNGATDIQ